MKAYVMDRWDRDIVEVLINIGKMFVKETDYPITFNRQKVYDRLHNAFFSNDGDIIVVRDGWGNFGGGSIVYAVADYQDEKFGYIEKFFVNPEYRREGVGRMLAEKSARWFDEKGCVLSFTTSTANIGETRQYTNLMAKYQYTDIGPTLVREHNGKI